MVTIIAMTGVDLDAHKAAMEYSCRGIEFGAVKIIYDETIDSIDKWNKAIVYDLGKHVDTPFALLIHSDGYVIHPECWEWDWLQYDFIGAPWPLPTDNYSYRDKRGNLVRVGNSVSLRSKRLLDAPNELELIWRPYYGNTNEDGFLCCHNREELEDYGVRFAPIEVAKYFSKEHVIHENKDIEKTFAFHQVN